MGGAVGGGGRTYTKARSMRALWIFKRANKIGQTNSNYKNSEKSGVAGTMPGLGGGSRDRVGPDQKEASIELGLPWASRIGSGSGGRDCDRRRFQFIFFFF